MLGIHEPSFFVNLALCEPKQNRKLAASGDLVALPFDDRNNFFGFPNLADGGDVEPRRQCCADDLQRSAKCSPALDVNIPPRPVLTGGVAVGDQVILSGQMAFDLDAGGIPPDMDAAAQTVSIMENIAALLAGEGLTCANIVKVTIFMTDLNDVMAMNGVYSSYVSEPYPARSTIGVSFLAMPNARVEIEATAIRS